jgi:hypothetical protein
VISGLCYKSFTIVTYDCNERSLYCKATVQSKAKLILANVAVAMSVNYRRRVLCKLKRALQL